MDEPERIVKFSNGHEVRLFGRPRLGAGENGCRLETAATQDQCHAEAIAMDAVESVILSLYSGGLLTDPVEDAIKEAVEAMGNYIAELGDRVLVDASTSVFAKVAEEDLGGDDLSFDSRMAVSPSENGAYVQGWQWVPNEEVRIHMHAALQVKCGGLSGLSEVGIDPDKFDELFDEIGPEEMYQRIKPLLEAAPVQRQVSRG